MITSKDNSLIKYVKSLYLKKYRDENKEYIVEGIKMCLEALEYSRVSKIVICEELLSTDISVITKCIEKHKYTDLVEYVSEKVFCYISDTKTPQGILVISKMPNYSKLIDDNVIFALDDVQDPGNVGTIIRTLDSAGFKNLIISSKTADPYNPKVVRSTMGAIFRLNIISIDGELLDYLNSLNMNGYKIVTTSLDTDKFIYDLEFNDKLIIVIGNESKGVSKKIQDISNIKVKIPMIGKTESLNAAVATSIIAYEKVRRDTYKR